MNTNRLLPDERDLQEIHLTALEILEKIGAKISHPLMKDRLAGLGCRIDGERVYFPCAVTEAALQLAPDEFTIYGSSLERRVTVGQQKTIGTNTGIFAFIYDEETGRVRYSTRADVAATTRLLDRMESVHAVYVSLVDATEVEPHLITVTDFAETLANTDKPLIGPGVTTRLEAEAVAALAAVPHSGDRSRLAGSPTCVPFICAVTPLIFPDGIVDAIEVIAEAGLPLDVLSNPVMGLTAPLTIAGTVAQGHAELLAMVVMAQAVRPGLPVLMQNTPSVADLRTLNSTTGSIESGMVRQVGAALARHLHLPSIAHGHSSSARMDFQSGQEKALNALLIASAHPSVLGGMGALGNCTLTSYESILIDNECFAAIFRALEGTSTADDRLDLNAFAEIAARGNAMSLKHTRKYMRSGEVLNYRLAVREGLVDGAPPAAGLIERAKAETQKLLTDHPGSKLPEAAVRQMDSIIQEYDRHFKKP
jgi:trimethylamine--corrinoid protein Co-methyltransferase